MAFVDVANVVYRALPYGHSKVSVLFAGTSTGVKVIDDWLHPLAQVRARHIFGCGRQLLLHTCAAITVKKLSFL